MTLSLRLTESSKSRFPRSELSSETAEQLLHRYGNMVDFQWPSPRTDDQWELRAGPWVGHIPVDDEVTLSLEPKVPLENIFGMLEYAYRLKSFRWLDGEVELTSLSDFYDRLARIFSSMVLERERRGLYKAYVPRTDDLPFVRGRLDARHHLCRPWSVSPRCFFQEHTANVEDNQILAWTLLVVARTIPPESRSMTSVRRAFRALQGRVKPEPFAPADCLGRIYHRLNQDYSVLHALCRFFLEHMGPTHELGDRGTLPFLVNTAILYEQFVAEWLNEHLPDELEVKAQERLTVGDEGQLTFDIDLVLYDASGKPSCVLDTKYKSSEYPTEADVQQVVAYAVAKGCREAVLVYPSYLTIPLDVMVGDIRVRTLTFSLDGDLDEAGGRFLERLGQGAVNQRVHLLA